MQVFNYAPSVQEKNEPKLEVKSNFHADHQLSVGIKPELKMFPESNSKPMEFNFKPQTSVADQYRQQRQELESHKLEPKYSQPEGKLNIQTYRKT